MGGLVAGIQDALVDEPVEAGPLRLEVADQVEVRAEFVGQVGVIGQELRLRFGPAASPSVEVVVENPADVAVAGVVVMSGAGHVHLDCATLVVFSIAESGCGFHDWWGRPWVR